MDGDDFYPALARTAPRSATNRKPPGGKRPARSHPPRQTGERHRSRSDDPSLPLTERLRLRDAFFEDGRVDPREFLKAFDHVPGLNYFIKDAQSRTLLNTREYAQLRDHPSEDTIVGKRAGEYLDAELAEHYEADDRKVLRSGQPLRNIVEIGFNERGVPDWIITDKFPLRDAEGRVVGVIGTMQSLEGRIQNLPHLGEVGKAAAFIRAKLGDRFTLSDVASHVGLSERQLQRLFHKRVGMTIHQFIIHSRVHAAAHELTHSKRPMSEIALAFGFTDQAAFTNTFRKTTGTTPSQYRSRHARPSG